MLFNRALTLSSQVQSVQGFNGENKQINKKYNSTYIPAFHLENLWCKHSYTIFLSSSKVTDSVKLYVEV